MNNDLIEAKDKAKQTESQLRQVNEENTLLKKRINDLEAIIKESEEVMDQMREELKENTAQRSDSEGLRERILSLSEQLLRSELSIEDLKKENAQYANELESIKGSHELELLKLRQANFKLKQELDDKKQSDQSNLLLVTVDERKLFC